VTIKPASTFFALALVLTCVAWLAAPASAATPEQPATKHHVPSHTTARRRHTAPPHQKIVHHPAHTLSSHHAASKPSDHHPLN
jgi:hypothetical protein